MQTRSAGVVIVGGGAGGLELAIRLAREGHKDVLLIDRSGTHVWKPRIHELAAGLRRGHVDELDYAGLAEHWGFAFERGELLDIDAAGQQLTLAELLDRDGRTAVGERRIGFDALVLAIGGVTPDMGVEGVLDQALMLDNDGDAERLFERYSTGLLAHAVAGNERPYQVVIVGSGATGVELGALLATDAPGADLAPRASQPRIEVTILEATDTFMPGMDEAVRESIAKRLATAGIAIEINQQVSRVTGDRVDTDAGDSFTADLTVWAAGRVGPPIADRIEGLSTNKKRQWRVRPTLQSIDSERIFVLGDCSYIDDEPAPPTAQAASEQAEYLATQLPRYLADKCLEPFEFKDKGTLLSLGDAGSVGEVRGLFGDDLQLRGRLARAAYNGLQRQHQFILLGAVKGTAEAISDVFGRRVGPRLKIH